MKVEILGREISESELDMPLIELLEKIRRESIACMHAYDSYHGAGQSVYT